MAFYDHHSVLEEFTELAGTARRMVLSLERSQPSQEMKDKHDELLGRLAVYDFLRPRPVLGTKRGMLSELAWYLTAHVSSPQNAYNPDRFESSRFSHVRALMERFHEQTDTTSARQPMPLPGATRRASA